MARIPMIYILDKFERVVTTLENTPKGKIFYDDKHTEILNNYEETFEFSCFMDRPQASEVKEDNKVLFRHRDGTFRMFTITKPSRVKQQEGIRYKRIKALNSAIELLYSIVTPITLEGYTVTQAVNYVLNGTRWQLGVCEFAGTRTFKFTEFMSAIKALHQIRSEFGLDIRYRVELENGKVTGRYVDFLKLGRKNGFRFDNKRDLIEISDEVDMGPVYTAVYCVGPGDAEGNVLTIADAEWRKATGDPADKPLGQLWVGDEEAREKWGLPNGQHRFGIYQYDGNNEDFTPEELLSNGWQFLQGRKEPKFSATAGVVLLGRFHGYDHKQAYLGDFGTIKDTDFDPDIALSARIVKIETSITDPTKDRVTFGNYEPLVLAKTSQIQALQSKLARKERAWDSSVRYVRQPTPPSDTSVIWIDSSRESEGKPDVIKTFDEATGMWVKATPEVAAEVGAYTQSETDAKDQSVCEDSTYYTDVAKQAAIDAAKADATAKANVAQQAAESYAAAQATLAQTEAEAYADGIVDAEEQARIDQAAANLAEAKQHADQAAADAEAAAKQYADAQLVNYVDQTTYSSDIADIQNQIDGNITSWFFVHSPTLNNEPAVNWTTNDEKNNHLGDLFYNTTNGYAYRFALENGVYKWIDIKDSDVQKALADAQKAQDTADQKRRVFVSQPAPPYDIGDLWAQGQTVFRCMTAKGEGQPFSSSDWQKVGDVTSQNTAADTSKVGGTDASTVRDNAQNGASAWGKFSGAGNTLPAGNVEFNFAGSNSKGGNAKNTDAVGSQPASTVQNATLNFNNRNDRKSTTPANPTIPTDGTAIDHTLNTDGSADISFEWSFSATGDAADIDGFIVYVYQSGLSTAYSFGSNPASEQVFYVTPDKRAFILYGVPANRYYTFGVQSYRIVDPDVDTSGVKKSVIVKSSASGENPYRPSSNVAFAGNVTGTVSGTAASTVVTNANAGKSAKDKIDTDVGPGMIEDTVGSQLKADAARDQAKQAVENGEVPLPGSALLGLIDLAKATIRRDSNYYIDDQGIRLVDPNDPTRYVLHTSGGSEYRKGMIYVEREDGFPTILGGRTNFSFAVSTHDPAARGAGVDVDGVWYRTANTTYTDMNMYSFRQEGRYLKLHLAYYTFNTDGRVQVIDVPTLAVLMSFSVVNQGSTSIEAKDGVVHTVDLGTPTGEARSIIVRIRATNSANFLRVRTIRMWLEG